jgi:cobalamin-dependent methionine synthase I
MIIVGERINSTRAPIRQALDARDHAFLVREAEQQWAAGADYLDVNTATMLDGEAECMASLVIRLQDALPGALLAIDSPNPEALAAGLRAHRGRAMLNSLTGERSRLDAVLPLIREFRPRVIVLTMDDEGLERDAQKRFAIGARLIERLAAEGVTPDDIFVDPLIFPVSAEPEAALIALRIMDQLKAGYPGVHAICGVSNVSHGFPMRRHINQAFMVMAMGRGLDAAIIDPLDARMMVNVLTARVLLGQDPGGKAYLNAYRQGRLALDPAPGATARA